MSFCYQTWSESLMQVYDNNDLYGGQSSLEVKCGKLCAIMVKTSVVASIKRWWWPPWKSKVKWGQILNYNSWLQTWSEDHWWQCWSWLPCTFCQMYLVYMLRMMMMMTLMKVEGHQRLVNHAIWLLNFVRKTIDSNWGQSCPLIEVKCQQRSNVANYVL